MRESRPASPGAPAAARRAGIVRTGSHDDDAPRNLIARLFKLRDAVAEIFWPVPAVMVVGGGLAAIALLGLDQSGVVPTAMLDSPWLYNGGGTGARTLLGAVASSTIGVAGTVFSITIAALSLAAGQMGRACSATSPATEAIS